jgi:uncharacterized protein YjbJ (UPF0337 family)
MDKDRMKGAGKQAQGSVKDTVGKATGNKDMQAEGKADKAAGKAQSTFGKIKDKIRGAAR